MAGFVLNLREEEDSWEALQFHIGEPTLPARITKASSHPRVITMQLDGDELAAALWGLENYQKPRL